MHISEFDYELPPELIATEPVRPRDSSRMMVLDRETGYSTDSLFQQLPEFLRASDVLVVNDTRVIRARVFGRLERAAGGGREIEVLVTTRLEGNTWEVLCRPGKRIRCGDAIVFGGGKLKATFDEVREHGSRLLRFDPGVNVMEFLETHGEVPLPPYIAREVKSSDLTEYQTFFADAPGAVAAPTAGLHFIPSMFQRLQSHGIEILKITLHVGIGTFLPVRVDDPSRHVLPKERFHVTEETATRLNAARDSGKRIIAVGTTTTRTLEYMVQRDGRFHSETGETDLFILPGYRFKAISGLLTNFHLPKSTLIMLVSAFASTTSILTAYRHAANMRYRFYSYGDCMLIL